MLLRNAEVRRTVFVFVAVGAAGVGVAWALAGTTAAAVVAATVTVLLAVLLASTLLRYRRIARMAGQVDAVLHGERDVGFERMREGELAVLASELDKMRSRLELANEDLLREKGALADALADVSHQINTPHTSLSLMTSLTRGALVEDGGHPGEVERLRTMERLEGRVEWLVSSLLKLARIDAGVLSFARARVDGAELVARAIEPLEVSAELAGVELVRDVQPGAGIEGDLAWTAEALENILKNCLEPTPAGGPRRREGRRCRRLRGRPRRRGHRARAGQEPRHRTGRLRPRRQRPRRRRALRPRLLQGHRLAGPRSFSPARPGTGDLPRMAATLVPELGRFSAVARKSSQFWRPSPHKDARCCGRPRIPGRDGEKVDDSGTRSSRRARNPSIPGRPLGGNGEHHQFRDARRGRAPPV